MKKKNRKLNFNDWFSNRMPVADVITLEQRSTYILPTKAGLLMMLIILLMMVASTNYQNNLAFLLTFLILSIGIISIVFTFKNLQGLVFSLGRNHSVFAGESLQLCFNVSSQSNAPHSGIGVGFDKQSLYFLDIPSSTDKIISRKNFIVPLKAKKRGWLFIPKIYTTSCFPFGLLKVWSWFKFKTPILIYPQPIEPDENVLSGTSQHDEGDSSNKITEEIEYDGIKAYKTGDPISRVDWKATAKERGMYVKSFTSLVTNESALDWDNFHKVEDELKISYLCFLVLKAHDKKESFSLSLPEQFIEKGKGNIHLEKCLSTLALYKINENSK